MFSPSALLYSDQASVEKAAQSLVELRAVSEQSRVVKEEAPPPYITLMMLEDTAEKLGWDGSRIFGRCCNLSRSDGYNCTACISVLPLAPTPWTSCEGGYESIY